MPLNNASLYSQQDKDEQAIMLRLAQGPDPFIRKTILLNPAVPIAAYALFAQDPEVSLREENAIILAKKMITYSDKPEQVPEWLVSVLTMCARDVVDSVRVGMAVTLRLCGALPRGLRMLLAKDPNPEVSGPILRSCPSLTEVDCEEIIMEPTVTEITLQALSERGDLSPALTQRLHNQQGRIRDLRLLQQGLKQALEHKKTGTLTDEAVYEAAKAKDRFYVIGALSLLSRKNHEQVQRVLEAQSPMGILSLCWISDLSARTAYQIQLHIAGILPRKALAPAQGGGYPFTDRQMAWNADFIDTLVSEARS
jgi:uncharacterized protein (DUF2336 family)